MDTTARPWCLTCVYLKVAERTSGNDPLSQATFIQVQDVSALVAVRAPSLSRQLTKLEVADGTVRSSHTLYLRGKGYNGRTVARGRHWTPVAA